MTGFININKKAGVGSTKEVTTIKHLTGTPCGHMGTLDPIADGVLPIAIGNSARLFDYFLDKEKEYIAVFDFGVDYDTLDTTGTKLVENSYVPTKEEIESVLPQFIGTISQIPPKYSAKNIAGKRGYELARAGVSFELAPKDVKIFDLQLTKQISEFQYEFKIQCGGGTYIRSLARDIAGACKTVAAMSSLRRTKSGIFHIEQAVESDILTKENINQFIIPTENVLSFPEVHPKGKKATHLFNGLPVEMDIEDGVYKVFAVDGTFYGLGVAEQSKLKMRTKLC